MYTIYLHECIDEKVYSLLTAILLQLLTMAGHAPFTQHFLCLWRTVLVHTQRGLANQMRPITVSSAPLKRCYIATRPLPSSSSDRPIPLSDCSKSYAASRKREQASTSSYLQPATMSRASSIELHQINVRSSFLIPVNLQLPRSRILPRSSLLLPRRHISRVINIALKKRQKKITIPKTVQVIDEEGNNLGVMSSDIALKLADSKNLSMTEVRKPSTDTVAVYRLFTSKQRWEQMKKKKQANKKDPRNVTKDLTVMSRIAEHDLAVKITHMREFLEKRHSVRVFVQTKYTRGMDEQEESLARESLVKRIVEELEGVGTRVAEDNRRRRGVVCTFKPTQ